MRTLHELYLLLWERIKELNNLDNGLCIEAYFMLKEKSLTENEYDIIFNDIQKHKPKGIVWIWFWEDGEAGTQQRKYFVLKMIEITKP